MREEWLFLSQWRRRRGMLQTAQTAHAGDLKCKTRYVQPPPGLLIATHKTIKLDRDYTSILCILYLQHARYEMKQRTSIAMVHAADDLLHILLALRYPRPE